MASQNNILLKTLDYKKKSSGTISRVLFLSFESLFQDCTNSQPPAGPQGSLPVAIHALVKSPPT